MSSPDGQALASDARARPAGSTPSKVLHVRNLPVDVTELDIKEICGAFGTVIKCKLHVGPARNQGFIEFQELEAAVAMIEYCNSGAEALKLKGKPLYLQYSTRTEVTNSSPPPLRPSNVLLVTFDNWKTDTPPSLDFVHLMFSAFGEVLKIAMFEKAGYYQALVQFPDLRSAREALENMNGHQLPRYMLPAGCGACALRVEYSEHRDLVIKHQSDRFRDFTNPSLPPFDPQLLPTTQPGSVQNTSVATQQTTSMDGGNVLHCMIDNVRLPVTVDAVYRVFAPYGVIQKIAVFEKNDTWQALVQFADQLSATGAKAALDGKSIYGNGLHTLRITFSLHKDLYIKANNERSWDYTQAGHNAAAMSSLSSAPRYALDILPAGSSDTSISNAAASLNLTAQDYERAHEEVVKLVLAALQQGQFKLPKTGLDVLPSACGVQSTAPILQSSLLDATLRSSLLSGYSQSLASQTTALTSPALGLSALGVQAGLGQSAPFSGFSQPSSAADAVLSSVGFMQPSVPWGSALPSIPSGANSFLHAAGGVAPSWIM